jgi:hypothetical protein
MYICRLKKVKAPNQNQKTRMYKKIYQKIYRDDGLLDQKVLYFL